MTYKAGRGNGNSEQVTVRGKKGNVHPIPGGLQIDGPFDIETPLGKIKIEDGSFSLTGKLNGMYHQFTGSGNINIPGVGLLKSSEIKQYVELAMSTLGDLGLSGDPNQICLDLKVLGSALASEIKEGSLSILENQHFTYSPTDLRLLLKGGLSNVASLGSLSNVDFDFSRQADIVYSPIVAMDVNGLVPADYTFSGHVRIAGTIPIPDYPLSVDGEAILNGDPNGDNESNIFNPDQLDFQLGINGTVNLDINQLKPVLNAGTIGLVNASAIKTHNDSTKTTVIGLQNADILEQLFGNHPIASKLDGTVSFHAYIPDGITGWWIHSSGNVNIHNIALSGGTVTLDASSMTLSGSTQLGAFTYNVGPIVINNNGTYAYSGSKSKSYSINLPFNGGTISGSFNVDLNIDQSGGAYSSSGTTCYENNLPFPLPDIPKTCNSSSFSIQTSPAKACATFPYINTEHCINL